MDSHTISESITSTETPVEQGGSDGYVPYTGMYMGQTHWQPLYLPRPNATAQVKDASAPAPGADIGDARNSLQSTQPVSVVHIANTTYNQSFISPYHAHPAVTLPQQHPLVLPHQYNQPSLPLGAFAGTGITQPPIYGVAQYLPFPIQKPYLQEHGDGLASTSSVPSQGTSLSTGRKRAAKARLGREEEKPSPQILDDVDFVSFFL